MDTEDDGGIRLIVQRRLVSRLLAWAGGATIGIGIAMAVSGQIQVDAPEGTLLNGLFVALAGLAVIVARQVPLPAVHLRLDAEALEVDGVRFERRGTEVSVTRPSVPRFPWELRPDLPLFDPVLRVRGTRQCAS